MVESLGLHLGRGRSGSSWMVNCGGEWMILTYLGNFCNLYSWFLYGLGTAGGGCVLAVTWSQEAAVMRYICLTVCFGWGKMLVMVSPGLGCWTGVMLGGLALLVCSCVSLREILSPVLEFQNVWIFYAVSFPFMQWVFLFYTLWN